MDKALEKNLEDAFRLPGVTGVACVDNNGLYMGGKGTVPSDVSGSISALSHQASLMSQNISSSNPVVCLESEGGMVLVKKADNITTAIFKSV